MELGLAVASVTGLAEASTRLPTEFGSDMSAAGEVLQVAGAKPGAAGGSLSFPTSLWCLLLAASWLLVWLGFWAELGPRLHP